MAKVIEFNPNKASLLQGSWENVWKRLTESKEKAIWVKLAITPGLFDHSGTWAAGINRAMQIGYLEIKASLSSDNNIYLKVLIDQNMGDGDGFGVGPDDYLEGKVSPDGTFIEPLHID